MPLVAVRKVLRAAWCPELLLPWAVEGHAVELAQLVVVADRLGRLPVDEGAEEEDEAHRGHEGEGDPRVLDVLSAGLRLTQPRLSHWKKSTRKPAASPRFGRSRQYFENAAPVRGQPRPRGRRSSSAARRRRRARGRSRGRTWALLGRK